MAKTKLLHRIGAYTAIALPFAFAAILAGCVGGLNVATLFPVANQHKIGFVKDHGRLVQSAGGADKAKVENGMTCNLCHATERNADGTLPASSRGSSITCLQCHKGGADGNPGHPADYLATHGDVVLDAGSVDKAKYDGQTCATCHSTTKAADGSIPESPVSKAKTCFTCHPGGANGSPKHPSDWLSTHGDLVSALGGFQTATVNGMKCLSCHAGTKDDKGNVVSSPQSRADGLHCFSCHAGGPTGSPGHPSPYKHGPEVRGAGGYEYATFNGKTCATCHAAEKDGSGNVVESPQKLAKDRTCYTCHAGGPSGVMSHPKDWDISGHATYLAANGGYKDAKINGQSCAACHTIEKAADSSIPASPTKGKTCFECHTKGEHLK